MIYKLALIGFILSVSGFLYTWSLFIGEVMK